MKKAFLNGALFSLQTDRKILSITDEKTPEIFNRYKNYINSKRFELENHIIFINYKN